MEDPYKPPCEVSRIKEAPQTMWRRRIKTMAVFFTVITGVTCLVLYWLTDRHSGPFHFALEKATAMIPGWLQFAFVADSQLPVSVGGFLVAVASGFLNVTDEKHRVVLDRVALVLALVGAVIVFGWALILVLAVVS